jgi:hypothetical protein
LRTRWYIGLLASHVDAVDGGRAPRFPQLLLSEESVFGDTAALADGAAARGDAAV